MVTFDLQPVLFALIALLALVAGGAIWLDRRRHSQVRARSDLSLPALNEAPFGVLSLSETGELRYANPAARRLLGLEAATGALPEAEWADRLLADADAARHDGAAAGRYRIVPLPPDRFVRWWAMAGGELVFLFDATEQQRADQAARRLLNDLSHELRTPLATILTHAEVQSLPNLPDATRAESLRLLKEETQRAVRLVNAMLELGRLETSGELAQRPVDLLAVAEAAVQQIMPQAEVPRDPPVDGGRHTLAGRCGRGRFTSAGLPQPAGQCCEVQPQRRPGRPCAAPRSAGRAEFGLRHRAWDPRAACALRDQAFLPRRAAGTGGQWAGTGDGRGDPAPPRQRVADRKPHGGTGDRHVHEFRAARRSG